jgi:hypothetical protein
MRIQLIAVAAALIFCLLPVQYSQPATATSTPTANTVYLFVEVESKVYRKDVPISSANPSERRWYFSNVIVQPMDVPTYSLIKQKIMPYFSRNVMDPFEARGFSLDYGEQDVRLNGESSYANYETPRSSAIKRSNIARTRAATFILSNSSSKKRRKAKRPANRN